MQINRVGKTRDLFKKTGDTNGKFHARIGTIKDRNSKDLTEQKRLRRRGKNTKKDCIKIGLNDLNNNDGLSLT